jgi:CDP-diacylglycerol--glycerol-3-phosphate 3-phosphatidyltransferase
MLSVLRMALSLSLLLFLGNRILFFVVFVICGLTDVLDGAIARKTDSQSALGARLDSAGDFLFFIIVLDCIAIWAGNSALTLLPYVAAVVLLRFVNLGIVGIRFRVFAGVHTWGNKVSGILVFISFGVYILTDALWAFIPVCGVAGLSALEETLILLTSKTLDLDRKSIFIKAWDKF